jgi:peptidyl-prolyl cis-trans isomerase D
MLDALRASSQTWVGRSIMAVVMGLLVIAFGFWGIADVFRGFGANTLARVGSTEITPQQFQGTYQRQLVEMQEQQRRAITSEEARERGIDRQVLSRMLSDAALDQEAQRLGLGLPDSVIARQIMQDDAFKGPDGQFNRQTFESRLQDNGLTEQNYVAETRAAALRQQIVATLTDNLAAPRAMLEIINRYYHEIRNIDYIVLPKSAAGAIPAPSDAELKSYFESHRDLYRKPEFRKISLLVVSSTSLADVESTAHPISDAEIKKRYDEVKNQRYTQAEQRQVQQIVFPDEKTANAASAKLAGGETFDALIAERKLAPKDTDLGTVTEASLVDKVVSAVVFSLPANGVSKPVKTEFGWAILHVQKIIPKIVIPLVAVKTSLGQELAIFRAHKDLSKIHDQIEDQRAGGKSVADAAKAVGLSARTIDQIDTQGRDKAGKAVPDLGEDQQALLKAIFASDIGVDNDPITTKDGGGIWFDVLNIDLARNLTFDEVKSRVTQDWIADQTSQRLINKAVDLTKKLDSGTSIAAIATAQGNLPVRHVEKISRLDPQGLSSTLRDEVFNREVGKAGSAEAQDGGRIIFSVASASVPPLDVKRNDFVNVLDQMKTALDDDMTAQFVTNLETGLNTRINQQAWQQISGAPADQQ